MSDNKCTCICDYDSVTGEVTNDLCDWCDANTCLCEYNYDASGRYLTWECEPCYKERTPWVTEHDTICRFLDRLDTTYDIEERIVLIALLLEYICTNGSFLKAFPQFYATCVAKVAELKTDPRTESIADILAKTESFLATIA